MTTMTFRNLFARYVIVSPRGHLGTSTDASWRRITHMRDMFVTKSFRQKASLHVHRLYHSQVFSIIVICATAIFKGRIVQARVLTFRSKVLYLQHLHERANFNTSQFNQKSQFCTVYSVEFTQKRKLKEHCKNFIKPYIHKYKRCLFIYKSRDIEHSVSIDSYCHRIRKSYTCNVILVRENVLIGKL